MPHIWTALLLIVALAASAAAEVKALLGARIIDGNGGTATPATLLIEDGRVKALGPPNRVQIPPGATRIVVTGATIVPGLVNAHGHVADTQGLRAGPQFYTEEN